MQEVQSNMESELLGYEPGLVGYWNFNEVQNSTVRDITGNGYDGTVYGAELSGDAAPIDPPPAVMVVMILMLRIMIFMPILMMVPVSILKSQ